MLYGNRFLLNVNSTKKPQSKINVCVFIGVNKPEIYPTHWHLLELLEGSCVQDKSVIFTKLQF